VLVDFGVARAIEAVAGDRVTATGMTVGTAGYMSPEQATAAPSLDYRSDLYSVGCVLFETLAGRPPFAHRVQSVVVQMQLSTDAPDVRTFRPDTPAPLAAVVARALRREQDERWQSAAAMRDALMETAAV
jgi:serine/threonine-protein kinase